MAFKRLEADDFVVSAQAQTATCWSNNEPTLTTFSPNLIRLTVIQVYITLPFLMVTLHLRFQLHNLRLPMVIKVVEVLMPSIH
jgi:hypothetical protein